MLCVFITCMLLYVLDYNAITLTVHVTSMFWPENFEIKSEQRSLNLDKRKMYIDFNVAKSNNTSNPSNNGFDFSFQLNMFFNAMLLIVEKMEPFPKDIVQQLYSTAREHPDFHDFIEYIELIKLPSQEFRHNFKSKFTKFFMLSLKNSQQKKFLDDHLNLVRYYLGKPPRLPEDTTSYEAFVSQGEIFISPERKRRPVAAVVYAVDTVHSQVQLVHVLYVY